MPIDFAALKTEIQTDPQALGYSPLVSSGNDVGIAALLNNKTVVGDPGVRIDLGALEMYLILQDCYTDIDTAQSSATAAVARAARLFINLIKSIRQKDVLLSGVFNSAITTLRTNSIITVAQANGIRSLSLSSRAEVLFGYGTYISDAHVARALRG